MQTRNDLREFSLKFADIMIGIILGLGFQWWTELHQTWQYIAFIFVYLNLIDYWVDYSPVLRRYPFRREIDVLLHFAIIFMMFYLIYSVLLSVTALIVAFVIYRLIDLIWLWRLFRSYRISETDRPFLRGWAIFESIEAACLLIVALLIHAEVVDAMIGLSIFIGLRIISRIATSWFYNSIYFEVPRHIRAA